MIKKVFFALAVCAALITSAAAADLTRQEAEAGIRENVSAMVQSYAAAVYQPNAASEAFDDFFIHGFWGGGKTMAVNERSPIIASLFNACVMQEALVEGISRGIARMQELQQDTLYLNGGPGWHNYGYSYSYFGYLAEEKDLTRSINTIVSAKDLYGDSLYTGPRNGNDEVMELLVGGLEGGILLRLQEVKGDTAFYTVEFRIGDIFDFDGDYKKISDKGYNVGRDKLLNNLGFLLTLFGLDKFDWSFTKILTVEVPYRTAVEGGNYRWVYDSDDLTLHSDGENGFLFNEATGTAYENAEGNVTKHYFQLDRPVVLRHDRPWVVQYDQMPYRSFVLAPAVNSNTCLPLLYQNGKSYTWFYAYDRHNLTAEEEAAGITSSYDSHYVGAEILGRFKYSSKRLYTYQLENIIAEDGSNMIWLSVFDHTLGRRVFGPTALDTHWRKSKGETDHTLVGTGSTMVSGENIIINYIGNKSVRITDPTTAPVTLDLRIYTNGTDDVLNWEDAAPTIEGKVTGHSGMSVNTVKDGVETAQKVNKSGSFSFQPDGKCDVVFRAPGCLTVTVKDVPGTGYYTFGTIALPQGDVNGDERINMQDLRIFLQNFNKTEEAIGEALTDVTEDGRVNMEDLRAFLQNFNKSAEGCTKVYEE